MAKNVSITEDGKNKVAENVAKIRTSLVGGGTCDWIPKDDVPLETLEVSEDGTYRPGEDYYGFDKVIASGIGTVTMGELIEKTVTKNGTYNITDESGSPYGYSKIIVNVDTSDDSGGDSGGDGGNTPVVGKDEDGNDTMAETDDDGNIVMTALPTEIKVIIPPTKLEYKRYEEIEYSGISVYAYISKAVHWLGATTTAISEGSTNNTVIVDSKSISVSVGDGVTYSPAPAVTYRLVWDGIKWVKPDNYSAEKAPWKSNEYPTGKIPFDELIFPVKNANYEDSTTRRVSKTLPSLPLNIRVNNSFTISSSFEDTSYIGVYDDTAHGISGSKSGIITVGKMCMASFAYRNDPGHVLLIIASDTPTEQIIIKEDETSQSWQGITTLGNISGTEEITVTISGSTTCEIRDGLDSYFGGASWHSHRVINFITSGTTIQDFYDVGGINTFDISSTVSFNYSYMGKTVYYIATYIYQGATQFKDNTSFTIDNNYDISDNNLTSALAAWIIVYGDDAEDNIESITLPVQWKRPGDGKILETTFTAWMKDTGSEAPQGGEG